MSAAERLLTLAQAAERSECSPKTLRRAIAAGELVAVRLGSSSKSDRIHPADLAAFWARKKVASCQSPSAPKGAIKSPSVSAEERLAARLAGGRTKTPAASSAKCSPKSAPLRLVSSRSGR
jgi:excisionase family DNA binding protein